MATLTYPVDQGVSGVYGVCFNGVVVYVGSSERCMNNRMSYHKALLRSGNHSSRRLQSCWDQTSPELTFVVIEVCDPDVAREREAHWSRVYAETILNEWPQGTERHITEEERVNKRAGAQRRVEKPGHREHLSERARRQHAEGRFGDHVPMSEESRQKLSASLLASDKLKQSARAKVYDPEEMSRRGRLRCAK